MNDHPAPEETLKGMGWFIQRTGERVTASVPTGPWDSGEMFFDISLAEFERLKAEPEAFNAIFKRHNEVSGDGWTAQRNGACIVYLKPDRFPDNRRFRIPNDAFERLRGDLSLFDEIHAAHHTDYA